MPEKKNLIKYADELQTLRLFLPVHSLVSSLIVYSPSLSEASIFVSRVRGSTLGLKICDRTKPHRRKVGRQ